MNRYRRKTGLVSGLLDESSHQCKEYFRPRLLMASWRSGMNVCSTFGLGKQLHVYPSESVSTGPKPLP